MGWILINWGGAGSLCQQTCHDVIAISGTRHSAIQFINKIRKLAQTWR